jgi:antitoxin VapB
LSRKRVTN